MNRVFITQIAEIASEQWGLVTTAQARAAGVSAQAMARLHHAGQIERLAHGVYRLGGAPPSQDEELRVAWLALDTRHTPDQRLAMPGLEVVSHRSAAAALELGDIDADAHEFTVPSRHQTRRHDVVFHRDVVTQDEWTLVNGLPVTTPLRTIADLARAHLDRGHLAAVVRDAMSRYDLSTDAVAAVLAPYARDNGVTTGDGTALVELMLDEAGIPASAVDMVRHSSTLGQLVSSGAWAEFRDHAAQITGQPAMHAAIQSAVEQALKQSGLRDSIAELRAAQVPPETAALARQIMRLPSVRRALEQLQRQQTTPAGGPAGTPGSSPNEDTSQP